MTDLLSTRRRDLGRRFRSPRATVLRLLLTLSITVAAVTPLLAADAPKSTAPHWAYQPVTRAAPPTVKHAGRVANAIDTFVLARLETAGVEPSPRTDRPTLIKRLYYDLLGLPPTPEEVEAFVNDTSPDAYEHLVDRLLKSPRFGERWGRHWLDMARYADSDGYEKDNNRPNAWRYRDWVIDAINRDMPVDQFTIEQLAGDLLPGATPMQRLATAFHRQTLTNTEGGTDQEEFRVAAVVDRVNTTGVVWLGLTVGCAQCHSHKYDKVTQREYYQLFAFYNNGDETNTNVPKSQADIDAHQVAKVAYDKQAGELEAKLSARRGELAKQLPAWDAQTTARLNEIADKRVAFHPVNITKIDPIDGVKFETQKDGSVLVSGANPDTAQYTLHIKTDVKDITGLRLEVFGDKRLPSSGPGRVQHGNFVLSELSLFAAQSEEIKPEHRVKLVNASADFSQNAWPIENAIDGDAKTGWAIAPQFGKDHNAVFTTGAPIHFDGATFLKVVIDQQYGTQHTIGRFRVLARTGTEPGDGLPDSVVKILTKPGDKRNDKEREALLNHFASFDAAYAALSKQFDELKKKAPDSPEMTVRVIAQRSNPRQTRILQRGDFLQPGDPVEGGTLAVLHPFTARADGPAAKLGGDRLDLARWLVDPANPLTPRVTVNHIWRHLFGYGIVRTVDDFGVRGEKPTHPLLLDYLASEFIRLGWSRKAIIKYIVMSSTYQQASNHRPELSEIDPENRLLHRQNRFRVEAEIVRDLFLSASGLLSDKIGGPSVFPPLPPDVAALSYANNFQWNESKGEDRYRRGMYTYFKRTSPHPNLTTFDCPDSNTTNVNRTISNTPLMALTTLNNVTFVEASQAMAKRVLAMTSNDDAARLSHAFQLCAARKPTADELSRLQSLLAKCRAWYGEHGDEAKKLIGAHAVTGVAPADNAAWVVVSRVLLNMDEFMTRE